MKIFVAASFYGKEKYPANFAHILESLKDLEAQILTPDAGKTLTTLKLQNYAKTHNNKNVHYESIRRGIKWAQMIILETSHEDFELGFLTHSALELKKPILALSIHEDFSKKIKSPFFTAAKYNEKNVSSIVSRFVEKNAREELSERFNLFLSKRQLQSIESSAKELGINNSEYLRMLIDKTC